MTGKISCYNLIVQLHSLPWFVDMIHQGTAQCIVAQRPLAGGNKHMHNFILGAAFLHTLASLIVNGFGISGIISRRWRDVGAQ